MRKVINLLLAIGFLFWGTSCLRSNLEVLPNASDAYIQSVNSVVYRWITSEKDPSSGEFKVNQAALTQKSTINKEEGTVLIEVAIPRGFPADQVQEVKTSNLVVSLVLSSASRIRPLDGAAVLGTPADWSKPNKYVVEAADGTTKEWTIRLELK